MDYIRLGKTDLLISRVAFGAMKLEKSGAAEDVASLVKHAYDMGINFFDTSRYAGNCEKLLGEALYPVRQNVVFATKTNARDGDAVYADIEESLSSMHIDYIDLYQYETDMFLPEKDGADGIYDAFLDAQEEGKIKHFGIVTQDVDAARFAVKSGLWETLQLPFNMLSSVETTEVVKMCDSNDIGFIAMQPLCGGLIRDVRLAFGYIYEYENAIPVWGTRTLEELDQILELGDVPPTIDEKFRADVDHLQRFFN